MEGCRPCVRAHTCAISLYSVRAVCVCMWLEGRGGAGVSRGPSCARKPTVRGVLDTLLAKPARLRLSSAFIQEKPTFSASADSVRIVAG